LQTSEVFRLSLAKGLKPFINKFSNYYILELLILFKDASENKKFNLIKSSESFDFRLLKTCIIRIVKNYKIKVKLNYSISILVE
jgi:hypothetical protein